MTDELEKGDWMNAIEAATYLRLLKKDGEVSLQRLRNLVNQGKIPAYKPFGKLLFKKTELYQLVKNSRKDLWKWR